MKTGVSTDLARMQSLQRQTTAARRNLDIAGQELSTREKSDRFEAAGGNLTRLFSLDRALQRNSIYLDTISITATRTEVVQQSLALLYEPVESVSVNLLSAVGIGDIEAMRQYASQSRRSLEEAVSVLNARVGGQALFSGTDTASSPLIDSATILAQVDAMAAASMTAQEAVDAISDWFSDTPPGGFYTTAYQGATEDLTPVEIGEGQYLDANLRADRDEIVSVLRAHAIAAAVAGGAFSDDLESRKVMLRASADRLVVARDNLLALRTEVGVSQNVLESALAERTSEREIYDMSRTRMLTADPEEVATRFQTLEGQLEAIYTVTSRLASLRFVNFMR